ncbi:DUF4276 family protein [Xanthomonas hyacinthi]|uniref:DUF4276 domain-containing protein n=1 Tax=Xanthomonas hyacinthi TaxID=56455 RepID=A0A2S7F3F2_9XANT|nr:DUF4276 family protein [Xanthomonas hyacinthi]KLD78725.1 hypothetical protein Y886_08780 [Xanthomonas hyacinthi DSM 19077]PPU99955.1 DUF4276 domain-containing protein [Xanthomonas hyacinthi]QGY76128.1 DUF4276 family protein [Xanthomonas hyacinthi]
MHIEVLVEDSSGAKLIEILLPRVIGQHGQPHTWRIIDYKTIGRIPRGLSTASDPAKRALLNQLPGVLNGYGNTPGIDAVVVVVDTDQRDCSAFLKELKDVLARCHAKPNTLFRLAIEEMEAWLLGDRQALLAAYPKARKDILANYQQDSICGTWELLADAIHPGGSIAIRKAGWPLPGEVKHAWASQIGPRMDVERNQSPSFRKFRDGIRKLAQVN